MNLSSNLRTLITSMPMKRTYAVPNTIDKLLLWFWLVMVTSNGCCHAIRWRSKTISHKSSSLSSSSVLPWTTTSQHPKHSFVPSFLTIKPFVLLSSFKTFVDANDNKKNQETTTTMMNSPNEVMMLATADTSSSQIIQRRVPKPVLLLPPPSKSIITIRGGGNSKNNNNNNNKNNNNGMKIITSRQMEALSLFSGGIAGTVAACLTNPLEVVKTQLQSSAVSLTSNARHPWSITKTIVERDGIAGFFRGLPATLVGIIPARSAYFYAYHRTKRYMGPYLPEGSPANALLSGLIAGIVGNSLTNPIWMVRTRMQLMFVDPQLGQRTYAGYGDAIRTIFREEGLGGFYKGILASYWGCTEGAIQFILYEQFKSKLLQRQKQKEIIEQQHDTQHHHQNDNPTLEKLPEYAYFLSAAAAKAIASVATYPHEVARTRLREQARSGLFKYHGMWQTLSLIAKEEGRKSLYAGMGVHLMKVVPNSALMFLTYEVVNHWLVGQFTVVNNEEEARSLMAADEG